MNTIQEWQKCPICKEGPIVKQRDRDDFYICLDCQTPIRKLHNDCLIPLC